MSNEEVIKKALSEVNYADERKAVDQAVTYIREIGRLRREIQEHQAQIGNLQGLLAKVSYEPTVLE